MKKVCQFFLFVTIFMTILVTGCDLWNNSKQEITYGSIQGKACYANASDFSDITVYLEKTDGMRAVAILDAVELGRSVSSARSLADIHTTLEDGTFIFNDLKPGVYSLHAESSISEKRAILKNITVKSGETTEVEDLVLIATGSIKGKILKDSSETLSFGYRISIAGTGKLAVSDIDGSFLIENVPAGTHNLLIEREAFSYLVQEPVVIVANETTDIGTKNFTSEEIYSNIKHGEDGVSINWLGSYNSETEIKNPKYLDAYFNMGDGCSYIYDGDKWTLLAQAGAKGDTGTSITWKGSLSEAPENPSLYWAYYNTEDGCSYIFDGDEWTLLTKDGEKGVQGVSIIWRGSYALEDDITDPELMNAYYNTEDGCSYIYDGEKWTLLTKAGSKGQDAVSITWKGNSAEAPETPSLYWAYFNTTDGCSYLYDGENWTLLAKAGVQGLDGVSIIWKGHFVSEEEVENPELMNVYFNVIDGCSYIYDGIEWKMLASGSAPNIIKKQPQDVSFELYSNTVENEKYLDISFNSTIADKMTFKWFRKTSSGNVLVYSEEKDTFAGETYTSKYVLPKSNYMEEQFYCVITSFYGDYTFDIVSDEATVIQTMPDTGLPLLRLNTSDGNAITSKVDYVTANFNLVSDDFDIIDFDEIKIKGRGNSSWKMPKKSYTLKFNDKTKVLGMAKSKKWVLIANYADKALLRNAYASYLGNEIYNSVWNPSFKPVDLVINGEYLGTYLIGEQIKIEENRVNIQSAADTIKGQNKKGTLVDYNDDGVIDLSDGGFVVEINRRLDENFNFTTTKGICISLKDPDTDDFIEDSTVLDGEVADYIKGIIQNAEDVLFSAYYKNKEKGYAKYLDVNSFIDWWFVNEIAKNNDASWFYSVYIYYNPETQKLYMGPNWDFDIGFGNVNYNESDNVEGFRIKNYGWTRRLFTDPSFVKKVQTRWSETKNELLESILNSIQSRADELSLSAELNFNRWEILGTYVWPNADGYEERITYQSEIDYMKNWLNERYTWLDSAIMGL